MALLKFPLNDNEVNYPARVSFEVIETESADFTNTFLDLGALASAAGQEVIDSLIGSSSEATITTEALAAHQGAFQTTRPGFGADSTFTGRRCVLYLPQAVNIADGVEYSNVDFGALGVAGEAGLRSGGDLGGELVRGAMRGIGSLQSLFSSNAIDNDVARVGITTAANRFLPDRVSSVVESATQVRANPNTRAMFRSVRIRQFSFTFKMIPTSPEETQSIKAIIKYFREEMYPEAIQLAELGNVEAGYRFPNLFAIKLDYRGKQIGTKILPSYLQSVNVVYNSSSMGFMEGGDFSEVDLTLSFVESSTLTKQLVRDQDY